VIRVIARRAKPAEAMSAIVHAQAKSDCFAPLAMTVAMCALPFVRPARHKGCITVLDRVEARVH